MIGDGSFVRCRFPSLLGEQIDLCGKVVGPKLFRMMEPARMVLLVGDRARKPRLIDLRYMEEISEKEYFLECLKNGATTD